ncbi:MAG TPA: esterase-like activity of phytase family protein [Rudaea sp.]|nr:esterase-like activity of phytase family protein [Rudaea sp.]
MTHQRKLLPLALAAVLSAPSAHAAVDLIAIGTLSGNTTDLSAETAAPLENGAPGNLLGGIGSGIAYAGCNTLLAVPDRGPNALMYNAAVSDTTSYINRFHTINIDLAPSAPGSALPFELTPTLTATTLLRTAQPLVYGDGMLVGLPDGAPALNAVDHTHYLTGRSDNFVASQLSTYALDARFDPESIRVSNDGSSVFISDEYGPYIYRFNRKTGQRTAVIAVPDMFAISNLSANGDAEISGNTSGRVSNKGMEGLAISPDGTTLYGAMQSPLAQDGGTNARYTRILRIDLVTGATSQFAYPLTNIGSASKPKYPTISDIVAINDHEFLVDERDGKGLGDNSTAVFKKLFHIDLDGAQDVSLLVGESTLAPAAVAKGAPFLDIVALLNAHGFVSNDIPAKLEGIAFGPDVDVNGVTKHTLFVANDNDFVGTVTDSNHPAGIDNPNRLFVFAVDAADLPTYEPQQLAKKACK